MIEVHEMTKERMISLPKTLVQAAAAMAATPHFRNIQRELLQGYKSGRNLVMVTSLNNGAGATTAAVALMRSIQMSDDTNGLLIDCNVFNPTLGEGHGIMDLLNSKGVSQHDIEEKVSDLMHDEDGFDFDGAHSGKTFRWIKVGSVTSNANELFASRKMRSLLTSTKQRYSDRLIIVDCPNALRTAEGRTLLEYADQVLVIMDPATLSPDDFDLFQKSIQDNQASFFGVLNKSTDTRLISQYQTLTPASSVLTCDPSVLTGSSVFN